MAANIKSRYGHFLVQYSIGIGQHYEIKRHSPASLAETKAWNLAELMAPMKASMRESGKDGC